MSLNPLSTLVDSLTATVTVTVTEAVEAAAAAPLNPVTLTLAVAAGLVLGLMIVRFLLDIEAVLSRCGQALTTKARQSALVGKAKRSLSKNVEGRSAESATSAQ